ncbi:MAG: hypothetical protein M3Q23_01415 [Actinomycetota bacterium]|nr:hypothetical protein [Actinomycetota bacterium]
MRESRSRHPSVLARQAEPEPPRAQAQLPQAQSPVAPDIEGKRDPLGKMALFSADRPAHTYGTLLVECSACHRETPVSVSQLVRSAFPFSLHLPLVKRYHSLMRCPACGRRAWMRVSWRA